MVNKLLIYGLLPLLLYACSAKPADYAPADFISWYRSNTELTLEKEYESGGFSVTYKSPELIYLLENGNEGKLSKKAFEAREKELGELWYFNFKITLPNSTDLFAQAGMENVNYPIDEMSADFFLVQNTDTAYCKLFHFERGYGLKPETDISLAFDGNLKKNEDFTLVFNDNLLHTGINKFRFRSSAINMIPNLRLDEL